MRPAVLLAAVLLLPARSGAQDLPLCGAPDALTRAEAAARLQALDTPPPAIDPGTLDAESDPEQTRRDALASLGPDRTLRIGTPVRPSHDPEAGVLRLQVEGPLVPLVPAGLDRSRVLAGRASIQARVDASAWGVEQRATGRVQSAAGLGFPLSADRAQELDLVNRPTCLFLVLQVEEGERLLVTLRQIEVAAVVDRETLVWTWAVEDDRRVAVRPPPRPVPVPQPTNAIPAEDADEPPHLMGGLDDLYDRLVYPDFARRAGIEGQVVVQFSVDVAGRPYAISVQRSPNDQLSEAAMLVVRESPFTPALRGGTPVAAQSSLTIEFRL